MVTLYRGVAALSQPTEQAISWAPILGNALRFANQSGRGTAVVRARVHPKQIAVYYPSFQAENEVILRPGIRKGFRETNSRNHCYYTIIAVQPSRTQPGRQKFLCSEKGRLNEG